MTLGVFALLALACYRVTRLVVTDELTQPLRDRVLRRWPPTNRPLLGFDGQPRPDTGRLAPSWQVTLVNCSWCVGVWTSLAGVALLHWRGYLHSWTVSGFAWLATSAVVGFLAKLEAL